ncbi:hypothetical protein [Candidatus Nitrosocosmicus hydrocola]|uniref:hypothetical protein n=1 Tax=Candidatus Nitrosocosmicus hydrocola TaxID=1826872 RepID=UPI0011E5D108|nr:hypothetical protein [Candidatus Nitrosocosmicus hydrocola]
MSNPRQLPDFFQYAMHILFAVVIGISFEISSDIIIPIETIREHLVSAGILILGYFIVITSWIGYYLSIKKNPHKGRLGYMRFTLDIFTIYLFYYMINLSKMENQAYQHDVFLYLLPLTFAVYLIWDIVKYFEYKTKNQCAELKHDRIHRIQITIDYLLWFVILAILYSYIIGLADKDTKLMEQIQISVIIISAILVYKYRDAKYYDSKRVKSKQRSSRRKNSKGF